MQVTIHFVHGKTPIGKADGTYVCHPPIPNKGDGVVINKMHYIVKSVVYEYIEEGTNITVSVG